MALDQAPAGRYQAGRFNAHHPGQGVGGLADQEPGVGSRRPGDVAEVLDGVHATGPVSRPGRGRA